MDGGSGEEVEGNRGRVKKAEQLTSTAGCDF
jgi:hypothetical protein